MGTSDTLQIAGGFARAPAAPSVPRVDPNITVGIGRSVNAAQIVMGLARELNNDALPLPGFPAITVRIQRALADENLSLGELAGLVRGEPALANRLVQLANAAAFRGHGSDVAQPETAIERLGFNVVRGQAVAYGMQQMEKQDWAAAVRPVLADIRTTSKSVAALCFAAASHMTGVRPDEALATGFFHLVGQLYLFARAPQEDIRPEDLPGWMTALDGWHPTIARTILDHWKVPSRFAEAVEHQNAIFEDQRNALTPLTRILGAAKLYYRLRRPGAAPEPEAEAALARVRLHGHTFDDLVKTIKTNSESLPALP